MSIRQTIKRALPVAAIAADQIRRYRKRRRERHLIDKPVSEIFQDYYNKNSWGDPESLSGSGSNIENTEELRKNLPRILDEFGIFSILDIPCGDFYWMDKTELNLTCYIGADLVDGLIDDNKSRFADERRSFVVADIVSDDLPKTDCVFCRDLFVHFSNDLIFKALGNIKKSGARYLLTTQFPNVGVNEDIVTGMWRPVDLTLPPFELPKPDAVVSDSFVSTTDPRKAGKCMALWPTAVLPAWD